MKSIKEILELCSSILEQSGGAYTEYKEDLSKLISWCYPDLYGYQFERVIHCKNCARYKRYKKKGSRLKQTKMLCEIDKQPRDPMFYCRDAIRKENLNERH